MNVLNEKKQNLKQLGCCNRIDRSPLEFTKSSFADLHRGQHHCAPRLVLWLLKVIPLLFRQQIQYWRLLPNLSHYWQKLGCGYYSTNQNYKNNVICTLHINKFLF